MNKRLILSIVCIFFLIVATNSIAGDEGKKVYSLGTITVQDQLFASKSKTLLAGMA